MLNTLITHLQIFGIGFSFGMAGPCFLVCTPVLLTYIVASKRAWPEVLKDIATFLSGRLLAYMLLGMLAGFSGALLKNFAGSNLSSFFRPLAGAVSIFFAVMVLINRPGGRSCAPAPASAKLFNLSGVFTFGFLIGISPCAPLLALLFDITLMSKGAVDGMFYALSFGLGTFLSGLITVGVIAGILTRIPAAFVKSRTANVVFRGLCALLLVMLGMGLIVSFKL